MRACGRSAAQFWLNASLDIPDKSLGENKAFASARLLVMSALQQAAKMLH